MLQDKMQSLEKTLKSTAETATDMVMSDVYGTKLKERIIECTEYRDETGLVDEMSAILEAALQFVLESVAMVEEGDSDPKKLPKSVLTECLTILHQLGPWCAGRYHSYSLACFSSLPTLNLALLTIQHWQVCPRTILWCSTNVHLRLMFRGSSLPELKRFSTGGQ